MTFERACIVLEDIAYKPGWRISLDRRADFPQTDLILSFYTKDVTRDNETTLLSNRSNIDDRFLDHMDEKDFINWLFVEIIKFERHESTEWFKYKGVHVEEPHPELKDE